MRYAITDLGRLAPPAALGAGAPSRHSQWLDALQRWVEEGVDFIQLREKALDAGEVFALGTAGMRFLEDAGARRGAASARVPKLLINGRPDLAAGSRADGVHLTGRPGELRPEQVRAVFRAAGLPRCVVSVSCHTLGEVTVARDQGADLILFGPVFGKHIAGETVVQGRGLETLRRACGAAGDVPVLALGGVTFAEAAACRAAGAAGIAGIRLFSGHGEPLGRL